MTDMLWIVPSRSRPHNISDLIQAWYTTRCYAELLVVVDIDDPELEGYRRVEAGYKGFQWVKFAYGPRLRLAGTLNQQAVLRAKDYDFIGFMGDDHRPRTPIWDGLMGAELRDMKTGLAYGNDLFQRANLPTSVCMTANIISTLGYMVPPTMTHLYIDNFWLEIGRQIDRISYMEHVVIEHVHPHAGKGEMDAQYEELNSAKQASKDHHAFETYKRKGLHGDVMKLKELP